MDYPSLIASRSAAFVLSLVVSFFSLSNALANDSCEHLTSPPSKDDRIYSPHNYTAFDPRFRIARTRVNEKEEAQNNLSTIFKLQQIITLQAAATKELAMATHSSLLARPPLPILSGLRRALEFLRNVRMVSTLKNDDLILFLSQSYELQHGVQTHVALTWAPKDQDQLLKMEVTDLLAEMKMLLWRQISRRRLSNDFVIKRIDEFFDIELRVPATPESEALQQMRNSIFQLLDMDIKIFYSDKPFRK